MLPWLGVLRKKEHVAPLLPPYLVYKLGKAGGVGQVHISIWFHAVAVAAGDEQHIPLLGQASHRPIFVPVAQAVHFQSVEKCAILLQEFVYEELMLLLAN